MRLLTLCTLGANEKTLAYDKIAQALQVDAEDVETWVVDAISNHLLEASMDQFKSVVQVTCEPTIRLTRYSCCNKPRRPLPSPIAGY